MLTGLTKEQRNCIIHFLKDQCEADTIILLGSAAREKMRPDSDVDIAYLSNTRLSVYQRFMLAQDLADLLGRDVDLIDFREASTVFQMQITSTGQIIYEVHLLHRQLAWMRAYTDYALLNEQRQPIIQYDRSGGTTMNQDIFLNKSATIRRCSERIHEEYAGSADNLYNFTRQDSIILNLQRACEACLDLAMHIIAEQQLGVPQSSRDAFDLLHRSGWIDRELSRSLKAMVGFRNIAMHDYQAVQVEILEEMIEHQLPDLERYLEQVKNKAQMG